MNRAGTVIMTMVVRDEEEVLPTNLDYHLAQGVDMVLVIDHASVDATPEILSAYAKTGQLRFWPDSEPGHLQAARVSRLLGVATREYDASWVIHGDADEFWMPMAGCLRDVLAAVPAAYGYLRVPRHDFAPVSDGSSPFHQRMVVRRRNSTHLYGNRLLPKVVQRPAAGDRLEHGNHDLLDPRLPLAPDVGAIEILHFQMRSFEQYQRKVVKLGEALEAVPDRPVGLGVEGLDLLAMHRRGELRHLYDSRVADAGAVAAGLRADELELDHRLQRFLSHPPEKVYESPSVQERLRQLWLGHDALERAQKQVDDLHGLLAAIRHSAVIRYTAPARRAYYRLRRL